MRTILGEGGTERGAHECTPYGSLAHDMPALVLRAATAPAVYFPTSDPACVFTASSISLENL